MKSDSFSFFEQLEKKNEQNKEPIIKSFIDFTSEIDGNFSVAFSDLKEQILLISSNCGSLYYFNDSQKKIFTTMTKITPTLIKYYYQL